MKELKCCPFCGGKGILTDETNWSYWVACESCGAEGGWVYVKTEDAINKAIDNWNMRA